jgi:hypothetical protein
MDGEHRHCEHELGHHHTCGHDHAHDDAQYEENLEMSYTAAFEAYAAERARALAAAEAGVVHGLGHVLPQQSQQSQPQWPRKRLADDPERLVRRVLLPTGTLTCVGRGCTRALQLDKSRRVDDRAGGRCSAAQRLDAGQRAASAAMRGVVVVIVFISMLPSLSVVRLLSD